MNYSLDNLFVKLFYEDCDEFEYYRNIAVNDLTNKNFNDFIPSRLVISDHIGYGIIFDKSTNRPITMNGLYPMATLPGIGRLMNRSYIFPEYRHTSFQSMKQGIYGVRKLIMEPLLKDSPFDTHILSMSNRGNRNNFFNSFYRIHNAAWPNYWYKVNGYVQTGAGNNKKSWQNILTDNPLYQFNTIDHSNWMLLESN